MHFLEWKYFIFINISLKYIRGGLDGNWPALVVISTKQLPASLTTSPPTYMYIWMSLCLHELTRLSHCNDVIMSAMASQITSLAIVYSSVYSGAYQRQYQNSSSLAFVRRIHRSPVNSPHKGPVTWKMFPFDDDIVHHASELYQRQVISWQVISKTKSVHFIMTKLPRTYVFTRTFTFLTTATRYLLVHVSQIVTYIYWAQAA